MENKGLFRQSWSVKIPVVRLFVPALLMLLIVTMLPACKTVEGVRHPGRLTESDTSFQKIEEGGWLSVFLNLKEASVPEAFMEITAVEARSGSGWVTLSNSVMTIESAKIGGGQLFIARNGVMPGFYESLRFKVRRAEVGGGTQLKSQAFANTSIEMELSSAVNLEKGDSHSLFVTWDVEKSLTDPEGFAAGLRADFQSIPLLSNLLFVACPDLDTVYVVRTDKNWVISSIGIPGRPTYIDIALERDRLYVLASEDFSIKVIDLTAFKLVDRYHMQMDYTPVFMMLSPDKRFAYVLDEIGKSIIKVDLATGAIADQATLNFHPRYSVYLNDQRVLAVSSTATNYVYFLNPENLIITGDQPVGTKPEGILEFGGIILVAESGSNAVASYEIDNRSQRASVNVGFSPMRLFLKSNQLYVTSSGDGTVTVMFPGLLNVSREIFVGGKPLEIAGSENNRWLYVGNTEYGGLTVVDATSNRVAGFIDLATPPVGMAVIE